MPGPDVIDQFDQPLALPLRGLDSEELAVVQVKVVDPSHVERPELGVKFLHLQLTQEGRELHGPLEVDREHGAGGEDRDQREVGVHQHRPVGRTQSGELLKQWRLKMVSEVCMYSTLQYSTVQQSRVQYSTAK